jgi:hypothetical protein
MTTLRHAPPPPGANVFPGGADGNTKLLIVLELDGASGAPSGTVAAPGGASREFRGWHGFSSAVNSFVFGDAHLEEAA